MKTLMEMLALPRPHNTAAESAFVQKYVEPVAPDSDSFGNRYRRIGSLPIVWSCHVDTVEHNTARKQVQLVDGIVSLRKGKAGTCLGADDTVGVWIMRHMIQNGCPGLYIFHRGEERGGLGSQWIADHEPHRLDDVHAAIAFDRKGTQSIITHQLGERCCSNRFVDELANALDLGYRADNTGVFTDTANYMHLVSECTNLSVGYEREHGPTETLDIGHAYLLRETMARTDFSRLGAYRDPTPLADLWPDDPQWQHHGAISHCSMAKTRGNLASDALEELVMDYPDLAAELLRQCGLDERDFMQAIEDQ